ncbi:MAG: TldD/PmbA family protein [Christensenellales bacterium]|jgi:TldD protein
MLSRTTIENVLSAALEGGGDFSEIYVEDTVSTRIAMTGAEVEDASYTRLHGAGIRIFSRTLSVYASTTALDEASLIQAARSAAASLKDGGETLPPAALKAQSVLTDVHRPFSTVDNAERIAWLKRGDAAARDYSGEITQVASQFLDIDQNVLIANSQGVFVTANRPRMRAFLQVVASDGASAQTGTSSPGCLGGFECTDSIDLEKEGRQAARSAVTMLHAPHCPAGHFPVVIDGGFGGVIFHEACGHSLEATSVSRGNSEFAGKLGRKIAGEKVTAIDDGTLPGQWGSIFVDDEGTPAQRIVLIERGILKNYMIDRLGGLRMGMMPTGSSRRQNYTFAPTSRMTNTFIAAGDDDEDEMIATMGDGLYAKRMGGGSVNPMTGEFNFSVTEGYWVKGGKIVSPVQGATLIGKGADVLWKVDRVGPRMWMGQGMCGSVSGSIPTNVGQPRIRVSGLTVGGKGGRL